MPDIESTLQAIFRWFHIVAGIIWIGHLYFFNFVNLPFQGGLAKEMKPTVNPPLILRENSGLATDRLGPAKKDSRRHRP